MDLSNVPKDVIRQAALQYLTAEEIIKAQVF